MTPPFVQSIQPQGFLSFASDCAPVPLLPLNLLIGPNGSGKSNLIEVFEILHAAPTDLASAIRTGGGAGEWLWKGKPGDPGTASAVASLDSRLSAVNGGRDLHYRLAFTESGQRVELVEEVLEEAEPQGFGLGDVRFYYRFQNGDPVINVRTTTDGENYKPRRLLREDLNLQQSILAQRRDLDSYPEMSNVGREFGRIQIFREWSFGRLAELRKPQPADLPTDLLLPDLRNLGLVLNSIEHGDQWAELNEILRRFLPRYHRLSTRIEANHVQIYLHEDGLRSPIPATRLSDGTIRFIALLAILLKPESASLICIEEPELGLHPDAVSLLAELLVRASRQTQLIVTTHSDALVSALTDETESVLICEMLANATELYRLESGKLSFWLDKYRLGEIWRMGELGGNP